MQLAGVVAADFAALWATLAEVLPRVVHIAAFVAAGVFLANLLVGFGLVERIAGLSRHLTSPANLPDEVGTAILTTAASTTAGYGMLAEFRESGSLDDRATLVAVTVNTFFGFVQHIFTFYAPVLIPILGLRVGLMYVGARAAVALAITLAGIVAGALLLSEANVDADALPAEFDADAGSDGESKVTSDGAGGSASDGGSDVQSARDVAETAARRTWSKLTRIVPRLAVVYTVVAVLVAHYDLTALASVAEPLTDLLGLPGAAVAVVAVFAFDTTTGAATIAPMVGETFTPREAVATMLVGGIVSFTVSTFKRSIPFQYGIWGPAFGSKVVAVNTALKVVFIALALVVLLVP